jgi:hypothetical protein
MRRWVSIATFSLVLLALPVWAQRHGGGVGGAHFSSGGGSAVRYSGSFHGGGFTNGSGGFRVVGPSHYHRGYFGRRYFYYPYSYYGAFYPYAGYYGWYDPLDSSGYQNDDQAEDSYASAYPQVPYREDSGLQRDVQTLSGKIDRLQANVEARNRPKADMEPATALVFRDRHVEEVRNYAISGGTLWVLSDKVAKKIPLAQLDLPATVKMNDDRGVDFQVPR